MAQDAISTCRQSLLAASDLVRVAASSAPGVPSLDLEPDAEADARLFLVRHLLVLKEIANAVSGPLGLGVGEPATPSGAGGRLGYGQGGQDPTIPATGVSTESCV